MTAIKISPNHFAGAAKTFSTEADGLTNVLRALAIDNARLKVMASTAIPDVTNNSTGTSAAAYVDQIIPALYDGSSSPGADYSALNTAFVTHENAFKVLVDSMNVVRGRFGMDLLVAGDGTDAVANTIPAMTKTVAAAGAASGGVSYATGVATLTTMKKNMRLVARSLKDIGDALGWAIPVRTTIKVDEWPGWNLGTVPNTAAAASPYTSSMSATAVSAFLTAEANNVATLATLWNAMMGTFTSSYALSVVAGPQSAI